MNLQTISKKLKGISKRLGKSIDKHSPEILIGCGLVGFATTCVLVAHEAPIAKERLDDLHRELGESDEEITKAGIIFREVKTVLPIYAPSIISGAVSCGCILGSYHITSKRTAALATAYELANSSLVEYQRKVVEKLGEKKEAEIRHEIHEEDSQKSVAPSEYRNELAYTDGLTVFKDFCGRYFRSNMDIVRKAEKTIMERLMTEMEVPLNDFYWELGIGNTEVGEYLCFNVDNGIDVVTDPIKASDGNTITYLDFLVRPMAKHYY